MLSAQFQFPKKGSKNKADNGKTVIFVMDQLCSPHSISLIIDF